MYHAYIDTDLILYINVNSKLIKLSIFNFPFNCELLIDFKTLYFMLEICKSFPFFPFLNCKAP